MALTEVADEMYNGDDGMPCKAVTPVAWFVIVVLFPRFVLLR
jgi:hypothetical protein